MSGMEALGVLASIAQLLEFGLKLSTLIGDVYNRVKEAPEKVIFHTAHIKQLVETALLIQENPALQNAIVHSHVKSTLTEAGKLQRVLERVVVDYTKGSSRKRLWKAVVGSQERRMIAGLDKLEKEKTALILCISFTHTETLSIIRDSVGALLPRIDSMDQGVTALRRKFRGGKKHRSREIIEAPAKGQRRTDMFANVVQGNRDLVLRESRHGSSARNGSTTSARATKEPKKIGVIINPVSKDDSTTLCGDFRTGATKNLHTKDSESKDNSLLVCGNWGASGNHKHENSRSSGFSLTICGDVGGSVTADEVQETLKQSRTRSRIVELV